MAEKQRKQVSADVLTDALANVLANAWAGLDSLPLPKTLH